MYSYFDDPPIVKKLHKAIFDIIHDDPTIEPSELLQALTDSFPELINEYVNYLYEDDAEDGLTINDCFDIDNNIRDLWEDTYEDERTGFAMSFGEWAQYFTQPNEPDDMGIYPIIEQYEYFANKLQKLSNN